MLKDLALIRDSDGVWKYNDLDSKNGSRINGRPVSEPTVLKAGDKTQRREEKCDDLHLETDSPEHAHEDHIEPHQSAQQEKCHRQVRREVFSERDLKLHDRQHLEYRQCDAALYWDLPCSSGSAGICAILTEQRK